MATGRRMHRAGQVRSGPDLRQVCVLFCLMLPHAVSIAPSCTYQCDEPHYTCVAAYTGGTCDLHHCSAPWRESCLSHVSVRWNDTTLHSTYEGCPDAEVLYLPPAGSRCETCQPLCTGLHVFWNCTPSTTYTPDCRLVCTHPGTCDARNDAYPQQHAVPTKHLVSRKEIVAGVCGAIAFVVSGLVCAIGACRRDIHVM